MRRAVDSGGIRSNHAHYSVGPKASGGAALSFPTAADGNLDGNHRLLTRAVATIVRASHLVVSMCRLGAEVLVEGLWMGVLTEPVLDLVTQRSYGSGEIYSSADWIDRGLHFWEELAVGKFFPRGGRVLVAAAGAGREMVGLGYAKQ